MKIHYLPLAMLATLAINGCTASDKPKATQAATETQAPAPAATQTSAPAASATRTTPSGLMIETLATGTGAPAAPGDTVSVHYTGWLTNGTKFDSSRDRNEPFNFKLGAGQVIPGWDEGVAGMQPGGKRRLTVPAQLAYGSRGAGGVIPPNAVLVFEVEYLGVK